MVQPPALDAEYRIEP